mmetsp:Transcript_25569/g.75395  ORF Transcript_25569/g.75395 Transcript_25569/m.75395 type:complete len:341 (+) Transcript_25569:109-1131(+)
MASASASSFRFSSSANPTKCALVSSSHSLHISARILAVSPKDGLGPPSPSPPATLARFAPQNSMYADGARGLFFCPFLRALFGDDDDAGRLLADFFVFVVFFAVLPAGGRRPPPAAATPSSASLSTSRRYLSLSLAATSSYGPLSPFSPAAAHSRASSFDTSPRDLTFCDTSGRFAAQKCRYAERGLLGSDEFFADALPPPVDDDDDDFLRCFVDLDAARPRFWGAPLPPDSASIRSHSSLHSAFFSSYASLSAAARSSYFVRPSFDPSVSFHSLANSFDTSPRELIRSDTSPLFSAQKCRYDESERLGGGGRGTPASSSFFFLVPFFPLLVLGELPALA